MEELIMFAQRRDTALVGMQILDENNHILSSDIVVAPTKEKLALEANKGGPFDAPGYMGRSKSLSMAYPPDYKILFLLPERFVRQIFIIVWVPLLF